MKTNEYLLELVNENLKLLEGFRDDTRDILDSRKLTGNKTRGETWVYLDEIQAEIIQAKKAKHKLENKAKRKK